MMLDSRVGVKETSFALPQVINEGTCDESVRNASTADGKGSVSRN